jgi:hypothetical protein
VRNAPGVASITVGKTFQTLVNGQWKASSNSVETTDTANGTHFLKSSVPINSGFTLPELRIVISITIGSHTKSKKVIIHISH